MKHRDNFYPPPPPIPPQLDDPALRLTLRSSRNVQYCDVIYVTAGKCLFTKTKQQENVKCVFSHNQKFDNELKFAYPYISIMELQLHIHMPPYSSAYSS
jgi:hypothetical protein